nr:hypothetical protein [Candidatus Saccharibacteria bacterium]
GMGYVALSRVRSLGTLSLIGINSMALKVSPTALAINQDVLTRSAEDAVRLAHLEDNAKKRSSAKIAGVEKGSDWSARLAEMRKTYPKAFTPWRADHDEELLAMHEAGATIEEMCRKLGRQPGGVRARLKKHLGEDVVEKQYALS